VGAVRTVMVVHTTVLALVLTGPSAFADCAPATDTELLDRAEVVFEGQALEGPTSDGTLLSPARFLVSDYLKGDGPEIVGVTTAVTRDRSGTYAWISVGIEPSPGEVWRIYADEVTDGSDISTSICSGSRYLRDEPLAQAPPPATDRGGDRTTWLLVSLVGAGLIAATATRRWRSRDRSDG
jgi:hypothetical protein